MTVPRVVGLNVVQPTNSYSNMSRDAIDRVAAPDFDSPLELWANMGFTSEETFFSAERDTASRSRHKKTSVGISRDASKERQASSSAPSPSASTNQPGLGLLTGTGSTDAVHNALAGFNNILANPALLAAAQQQTSGRFNPYMFTWPGVGSTNGNGSFESLLSGFPVDPFLVPPTAVAPFVPSFGAASPSLPPLTIRGTEDTSPRTPTSSTNAGIFAIDPALSLAPPVLASAPLAPLPASTGAAPPPAKRQKTSAAAATATPNTNSNTTTMKKTTAMTESPTSVSPVDENKPELAERQMTPLTAAEDKRRRNTAASARFRAKKKEREAAMEQKSKELEDRVTELERECESLRKENGWLKGLVIGASTSDGIDLMGLEEVFNAFKAATTAPSVVGLASNEERTGSKRKRTTA